MEIFANFKVFTSTSELSGWGEFRLIQKILITTANSRFSHIGEGTTKVKMKEKAQDIVDGVTIKYHANGKTIWSKGKIIDGKPEGYWEWYRIDGTIKRSGNFVKGEPVGEWTTYDSQGNVYKVTKR